MIADDIRTPFFELPPEFYRGKLPFIATSVIQELYRRKIETIVGVFRLSGNELLVKDICSEFNRGPIRDWTKYEDIHTVCSVVKRYFKRMSEEEPLIPIYVCENLFKYYKNGENVSQLFKEELASMIPCRYNLLKYLIKFLKFIADRSDENKMTPANIAICFAPNIIIITPRADLSEIAATKEGNNILDYILTHADEVFEDLELSESIFLTEEEINQLSAPRVSIFHIGRLMTRHISRSKLNTIPYIPSFGLTLGRNIKRPSTQPPPPVQHKEIQELSIDDYFLPPIITKPRSVRSNTHKVSSPTIQMPVLSNDEVHIPTNFGAVRQVRKSVRRPPPRAQTNN